MDRKVKEYSTIAGHARLSWYTSGDEDNFGARESMVQPVVPRFVAGDNALSVDMPDISGDTWPRDQCLSLRCRCCC